MKCKNKTFIYEYIPNRYNNISKRWISMVQTTQLIKKENSSHSPNLSTVVMVEKTLKDAGELLTLAELKRRLPRKVMHNTLLQILDYLQVSGKILIGTKGILWIFAEKEELKKLMRRGTEG